MHKSRRVFAVLGPTNTGKTSYAIERMLAHKSGIIGLPLRLLAREVYERIVTLRGPSVVALITGEERIVPARTRYWVCTVEAMPESIATDFLAIDEIQLCADPERGHVFTDRLLRARGLHETQFLGAATMRGPIAALIPDVSFLERTRMSDLTYAGSKKISRLRPRSAIIGFSVENVYTIAEIIRRQKGGAAVVMGALSPRTRNAQVEMYQSGEVDYLVATDAIGMGLNLDIDHVAFSGLVKFDGRRMRALAPNELAQIAGRAGRGLKSGSFGVTGDAPALDTEVARAITGHRFAPLKKLNWRNHALQFGSVDALIRTLEQPSPHGILTRARMADDLAALRALSQVDTIYARCRDGPAVKLLWQVCQLPDFRGLGAGQHAQLLEVVFSYLYERGAIPDDWLASQLSRIDRCEGDIDALSKRLAFVRTWTYVAQRAGWTDDIEHWRARTRDVEDRLSDALHTALTRKFVDRRTSVLLRRLGQKEAIVAEVDQNGQVSVEGETIGKLEGFRFTRDKGAGTAEDKAIKAATLQALVPHFHLRADRLYNAPDTEFDITEQGGLMWGTSAVGKLIAAQNSLQPQAQAFVDDVAGPDIIQKVTRRLQHFIDRKVAAQFEPLIALANDAELTGLARGFAFELSEHFGIVPRSIVANQVKSLDQDARAKLRKHGVRFGQFTIFMPALLKPAATRLRLVLWSLSRGLDIFPQSPPPGLVTIPAPQGTEPEAQTMSGYRIAGARAIRIDMLERLADMLRAQDTRGGFEAHADMLSITGTTLGQFADLMQGLGYKARQSIRDKIKAPPQGEAQTLSAPAPNESGTPEIPPQEDSISDQPLPQNEAEPTSTQDTVGDHAPPPAEQETFYTFTWGSSAPARGKGQPRSGEHSDARGKHQGSKKNEPKANDIRKPRKVKPGRKGKGNGPAHSHSAAPPRPKRDKPIDPDNPFAVLAALKDMS